MVLREDLQRRLWPNGTYVDFDKGLNTAVKKLRYALGDSSDKPVFIETIPRRGYRFIAPVSGNGFGLGDPQTGTTFPTSIGESIDGRSEKGFPSSNQVAGSRKHWYALFAAFVLIASLVLVKYNKFSTTPPLDLQNMEVTLLTSDGKVREMAISPNGLSLAYARDEGLEQSLWLKRIDTGSETQLLTADTVNFSGMEFSPN